MRWSYLGEIAYQRGLELMEQLREGILRGLCTEALLLLQHPPVITLGRSAAPANVLASDEERERRGVQLAHVGRGGDVTYHGPGQLVGYPVRRIGRGVREHVGAMTDCIVELLGTLDLQAWWQPDRPGVWCAGGKIAAVGVDATGGIATHGFALNVDPDLSHFQMIVPCGLQAPVTSIARELGAAPGVEELARRLAPRLCRSFNADAVEVPPEEILGGIPGARG